MLCASAPTRNLVGLDAAAGLTCVTPASDMTRVSARANRLFREAMASSRTKIYAVLESSRPMGRFLSDRRRDTENGESEGCETERAVTSRALRLGATPRSEP